MKGLYTGPPRRFRELVVYAKYTFAGKTALKYTFAYISHVDKHALCYNEPRAEMRYVSRLIESAQSEIVLIDPYSDAVTLEVLSKKRSGVKVRLVCKDRGKPTQTEIAKFNRQYKGLAVTYSDDFHDRFLIIDNTELHGLGSSINCLGRRVTSYTTRDAREIAKLLAMVP